MLNDVTILGQKEGTAFEVGGTTRRVITTTFMVGRDGPFTVTQDEATFDPNENIAAIQKKADAVRATRQHPAFGR